MPLHLPNGDVVAPEWMALDKTLKQGDGIMWTGDPRLYLQIGVLENRATGQRGTRLEVWRSNEDGSEAMIGHWHPSEQHRVGYDLAQMRTEKPGHVSVLDKIDHANEALQQAASDASVAATTEVLEHAVRLHVERENGKHKHFIEAPKEAATP